MQPTPPLHGGAVLYLVVINTSLSAVVARGTIRVYLGTIPTTVATVFSIITEYMLYAYNLFPSAGPFQVICHHEVLLTQKQHFPSCATRT